MTCTVALNKVLFKHWTVATVCVDATCYHRTCTISPLLTLVRYQEPQRGFRYSDHSQGFHPRPGAYPALYVTGTSVLSTGVKRKGRDVQLTAHLLPLLRLTMGGVTPPLLLCVFMEWTGTALHLEHCKKLKVDYVRS